MWTYGQQPTRLLCPQDSLGKTNGVGCHFLLQLVVRMWKKKEPLYTLDRKVNLCSHVKNNMVVSKIRNCTTIWSSNSVSGCISEEKKKLLIWKDVCIPMFIAPLFTIVKIWKQSKCPSRDEWIKKICGSVHMSAHTHTHTHTMKHYSAIKRMNCCHW